MRVFKGFQGLEGLEGLEGFEGLRLLKVLKISRVLTVLFSIRNVDFLRNINIFQTFFRWLFTFSCYITPLWHVN